jgi:hypothetical protein
MTFASRGGAQYSAPKKVDVAGRTIGDRRREIERASKTAWEMLNRNYPQDDESNSNDAQPQR